MTTVLSQMGDRITGEIADTFPDLDVRAIGTGDALEDDAAGEVLLTSYWFAPGLPDALRTGRPLGPQLRHRRGPLPVRSAAPRPGADLFPGRRGRAHLRMGDHPNAGLREAAAGVLDHRAPGATGTWPSSARSRAATSASSASAASARPWPGGRCPSAAEVRPTGGGPILRRTTRGRDRHRSAGDRRVVRPPDRDRPRHARRPSTSSDRPCSSGSARAPTLSTSPAAPWSTRTPCAPALDEGRVARASLDTVEARAASRGPLALRTPAGPPQRPHLVELTRGLRPHPRYLPRGTGSLGIRRDPGQRGRPGRRVLSGSFRPAPFIADFPA